MYERMLDKQHKPTDAEFFEYCGEAKEYFVELDTYLLEQLHFEKLMRFPYGNGYGWGYKYFVKSKLMCDVFAEKDAFSVMIRLTNEQFERIYQEVAGETKEAIDHKYPCGEGGWLHYRVITKENLEDIKKIIWSKTNKK